MMQQKTTNEWTAFLANKGHAEWKEFMDTVGDTIVFYAIESLRHQIEPLENWKQIKQKAREEYLTIPDSLIEDLLLDFEPFIQHLPAGHGIGHLHRDIINLSAILHDPELADVDPVELFAGILGGTFHDIGNSIVARYKESQNYSGHAEVGAFLFGIKAQGKVPPNLLFLVQLVIAAHTNYLKDMPITKNGKTLVKRAYEDSVIDDNKKALHIARQSDRADIQGIPGAIRHSITKVQPTSDLSEDRFQHTHKEEMEDFKHQFNPVIRTKEYRDSLTHPADRSTNILEHLRMFADSTDPKSPYARYDSQFIREIIMNQGALEQYLFIAQDVSLTRSFSGEERKRIFEKFFRICKLFEPAEDIDGIIMRFRSKLNALPEKHQNHWANAFEFLTGKLFEEYYERKRKLIETPPHMKDAKLQKIVNNLHSVANTYIENFTPLLIEEEN